ncbi:GTPase Era [Bacteroidetes bacterium endosymbiont of Geopemphigus sp.]|uniref:GTPase Era n=1 Tax=Bacteroidetes bacterium endosymbiont of Geopemphigus sp. TaxID=2047937 RepID=UPI000CD2A184|nr:GTPase Era [Bacteroidetes bacterium endosymbiont of Geopemphigus sp.]
MNHKTGFVSIIGEANVGKSTLMNALVGERLSTITPKAQTTRHRIFGILNSIDYQIIFSDTPGLLEAAYPLQKAMMKFVEDALKDADVLLYMAQAKEISLKSQKILENIQKLSVPILLLINKIDCIDQKNLEGAVEYWHRIFPESEVLPISALKKFNTDLLLGKIISLLPEGHAYYPKEDITDRPERFFVNEIVREKILFLYKKEIPYSTEVVTESFEDGQTLLKIQCVIYLERDSQKGILIGHQGKALKNLGIAARKSLEEFFKKKVFLKFHVKVNKNWRSDKEKLKKLGYLH